MTCEEVAQFTGAGMKNFGRNKIQLSPVCNKGSAWHNPALLHNYF
jgi:hypothetical protein